MTAEQVREICLSLPAVTETVQWDNDLVFKVGGKMFAIAALEPSRHTLSFKCTPEDYALLTERPGIVPAPYLARAQWVALETGLELTPGELQAHIRKAYDAIVQKLPKKVRASMQPG